MGLTKFVYDTKLGGASDSFEGRGALQRDLETVEGWAITNHQEWGNPGHSTERGMRGWKAVSWKGTWGSLSMAS